MAVLVVNQAKGVAIARLAPVTVTTSRADLPRICAVLTRNNSSHASEDAPNARTMR